MIPEWVLTFIKLWIKDKRTGSITINFFKGGITNIKEERTFVAEK